MILYTYIELDCTVVPPRCAVPNRTWDASVWPDLHNRVPEGRYDVFWLGECAYTWMCPSTMVPQATHYTPLGIPLVLYFASVSVVITDV